MLDLKFIQVEGKALLIIAIILLVAFILTRVTRWLIRRTFIIASDKIKVDHTRYRFFRHSVSFIIWIVAFATIFFSIPELKSLAVTLFAGAGILVAIAGFAAQEAFANIISGLFIVIFKPFRVGDLIKVGDRDYGIVEDITLRHTVLNSFENKRIIIPNSVISNETILNDSIEETKICKFIEFMISYDSNVDKAIKIVQKVAENHPLSIDGREPQEVIDNEPVVPCRLVGFEESAVKLRAYVWTKDPILAYRMHHDINKAVKAEFEKQGIEIPYPYRTVVYKKDLDEARKHKA